MAFDCYVDRQTENAEVWLSCFPLIFRPFLSSVQPSLYQLVIRTHVQVPAPSTGITLLPVTFISFRRLFLKYWSPGGRAPFPLNGIGVHFNNPPPPFNLASHHWSGYSKFCCSNKITLEVKGLNSVKNLLLAQITC